ncbi:MAG TPA: hypothetical protein VGR62_22010 [Candidatus Binatia bacterium]|nr:hypothetical protein [Candidatus Binatia bacterium]
MPRPLEDRGADRPIVPAAGVSRRRRDVLAGELAVITAYVLLGGYAMWPMVTSIRRGELFGIDSTTSAWALWWMKECVLHLRNPWVTDAMFAPQGTSLAYFALAPLIGVVWMPVTLLLGPAQAVNALSVLLPMLAAYATYRLARAFALSRAAAVATGAFYGFAPITLGRAAVHVMLAAGMVAMPLALLAAIHLRRRARIRDAAVLGLTLAATVLIDVSIAPLVFALVGLYWLGVAVTVRRVPMRHAPGLALVTVGLLLLTISPQLYVAAQATRSGAYQSDAALMAMSYRIFGTDVLALVRPGPGIHVPPVVAAMLDRMFATNLDVPATTGMAVFVLAAIGVVGCWRRRLARWAAAVWLVAFVFALGPRIAVGEHPTDHLRAGWTPFPMTVRGQPLSAILPYSWLVQLPGLGDFRVAQRFNMLAALPATLLAGLGVQWLLAQRSRPARLALLALASVAVLEMAVVANVDARIPVARPRVYGPIRRDPSRSIVVDVPLGWVTSITVAGVRDYRTEPVLRGAQHHHPIAWGFTNRLSDWRLDELAAHPFYAALLRRQYGDATDAPPWPTANPPREPTLAEARADRERLGVGWVVLHPEVSRDLGPWLEATGFTWSHGAAGFDVYRAR